MGWTSAAKKNNTGEEAENSSPADVALQMANLSAVSKTSSTPMAIGGPKGMQMGAMGPGEASVQVA